MFLAHVVFEVTCETIHFDCRQSQRKTHPGLNPGLEPAGRGRYVKTNQERLISGLKLPEGSGRSRLATR